MYIKIDESFQFTFTPDFSILDGVYLVKRKSTYDELLKDGIDMVASLYSKVGKTQDDWDTDLPTYRNDIFYMIEAPNEDLDAETFYIPEGIIDGYPDPNIHEYGRLSIMANLGTHADKALLSNLVIDLQTILQTNYGITTTPRVVVYDTTWLSEDAYAAIVAAREAAKGTIINYKSESVRLEQELVNAQTRIAALEQIIANP